MNAEKPKIIIPESIHTYTYLGEPVETVPRKTPKKQGLCPSCEKFIAVTVKGDSSTCPECKVKIDVSGFAKITTKAVTTKDMKQYGLFPSISRMCSYGEYPIELSNWYKTNLFHFIAERYDPNRETWLNKVQSEISTWESRYADRGTVVHEYIQRFMEGEDISVVDDDCIQRCTQEIEQWCNEVMEFDSLAHERSHSDPLIGMGGVIDLQGNNDKRVIADFKTKHNPQTFETIKKGQRSYLWSAIKQLAGYCAIHKDHIHEAYVIPINNETGETLFIQLTDEELVAGKEAIMANANAWFANERYDPRQMYKENQCWSLAEIMAGEKS